MLLDNPLDLPGGDGRPRCPRREDRKFHLAISDMPAAERKDTELFRAGHLPGPRSLRTPACRRKGSYRVRHLWKHWREMPKWRQVNTAFPVP
jgi:hypothetical protein